MGILNTMVITMFQTIFILDKSGLLLVDVGKGNDWAMDGLIEGVLVNSKVDDG